MTAFRHMLTLAALAGVSWFANAQDSATDAKEAAQSAKEAKSAAADAKEAAKEAKRAAARSGEDFTGDTITLQTNTPGFKLLRAPGEHAEKEDHMALVGTKLRVMNDVDGILYVLVEDVPCRLVRSTGGEQKVQSTAYLAKVFDKDCPVVPGDDAPPNLVEPGEAYTVSKPSVREYGYHRAGLVYGLLLVPYKYHAHDKSFSSSVTVGPYIGTRVSLFGFDTATVLSIGISSLNVTNSSGEAATQTGYTMAAGVIWSVTKNKSPLQLGLLVGKDWAGSNSPVPYKHEGKTWVAAQIGFNFSD